MFRRAMALLQIPIRLRLRTLLLIVLALGIGLGIYVHRARRQQRAAVAIRQLGGTVAYDYQLTGDLVHPFATSWEPEWLRQRFGDDFFHTVVYVHVGYRSERSRVGRNGPHDDEFLSALDDFPGLTSVGLSFGPHSEDGLREIGRLRGLKHLALFCPQNLTDRGVAHLAGLQYLETISLNRTNITDESVRLLGELPRLENLDLRDNHLTDQGLLYAGHMHSLKLLWVGVSESVNPAITDDGLLHLEGLSHLEGLDLEGTGVSEQGLVQLTPLDLKWLRLFRTGVRDVSRLHEAFPDCVIDR